MALISQSGPPHSSCLGRARKTALMCTNSTSRRLVVMTPQHGMCGQCSMKLELGCENPIKGIPPVRLRGPVLCPCPGLNDDDEDRLRARAGAGDHLMSPTEGNRSLVRSALDSQKWKSVKIWCRPRASGDFESDFDSCGVGNSFCDYSLPLQQFSRLVSSQVDGLSARPSVGSYPGYQPTRAVRV